jgi:PAS domain-containing protein
MSFIVTPYSVILFAAAFISATVFVLSLRRGPSPGNRVFTGTMAAAFLWTFASGLEAAAVGVPLKILFAKISFFGTSAVGPLLFFFAVSFGSGERRWKPFSPLIVSAWPAAAAVLVATNELHGLMWSAVLPSDVAGSNMARFVHTPLFYAAIGYDALLSVAAAYIFLRTVIRSHRLFRAQVSVLVASIVVFWASFVLYMPPLNPLPGLDTVAVGFSLTGLLLLIGIRRYRLLDIVPVARDVLVEKMADGLVVLDAHDRIVDINPAARERFRLADPVIGRHFGEVFPFWSRLLADVGAGEVVTEMTHPDAPDVWYDLLVSRFHHGRAGLSGRLLVFRDVTERTRVEREKERLITELTDAVTDIKALRGLLPICSSCKKIRDDGGYWQHLESYIAEHSEAQFSHSLCPDCLRRLYPDLADRDGEPPKTRG